MFFLLLIFLIVVPIAAFRLSSINRIAYPTYIPALSPATAQRVDEIASRYQEIITKKEEGCVRKEELDEMKRVFDCKVALEEIKSDLEMLAEQLAQSGSEVGDSDSDSGKDKGEDSEEAKAKAKAKETVTIFSREFMQCQEDLEGHLNHMLDSPPLEVG